MKLKKITAAIISAAMTISMGRVLPAHAADTASGDVNIIASVSGAYSLVIPQTITLSRDGGGDGVGTYTGSIPVCVKGTIKSSQYVTVSVNTPTLICEDGTTAAVALSQPKDTWTCDEVSGDGTTANFAVSTELAQPGDWSGTATFGCEMGSNITLISFSIAGVTYQAEKGMTWEAWADSSYNTDGCFWITLTDNVQVGGIPFGGGQPYLVSRGSTQYSGYIVSKVGMKYVKKDEVIYDGSVEPDGYKQLYYCED